MTVEGHGHHVHPEPAAGEVRGQLADENLGTPRHEGRLRGADEDGLHPAAQVLLQAGEARPEVLERELEREPSAVGLREHEVDPAHQVLHVGDQLLLQDHVALVGLAEVAAVLAEDPVVVPVGGGEALLEVPQDLVVELHLPGVERALGLEAGPQDALEEAAEEGRESSRGGRLRAPGLVDRGGVGGRGRRLLRGELLARHGLRRPDLGSGRGGAGVPPASRARRRTSSRTRRNSSATSLRSSVMARPFGNETFYAREMSGP